MSDKENVKRGSGCLLPFITFFGLAFIGSLADAKNSNNLTGIALTFFITVFLLIK